MGRQTLTSWRFTAVVRVREFRMLSRCGLSRGDSQMLCSSLLTVAAVGWWAPWRSPLDWLHGVTDQKGASDV